MREPHSSISVLWCFSFNAGLVYFCHLPSLLPFIQRLRFQHLHAPSLGTIGICGATSSLCGLWRGFIDDIKRSSTSPHISRLHPERRHAGVSQPNHQGAAARDTRNLARLHPALLEEGPPLLMATSLLSSQHHPTTMNSLSPPCYVKL